MYMFYVQQKIQKKKAVRGGENNPAAENQTCESIFRVNPESWSICVANEAKWRAHTPLHR